MRLIDADRFKNWIMDRYICFDHTLDDIDAQPTVDAISVEQAKWIPVSERVPNSDDWVIITVLDESGDTPYRYTDFGLYLDAAKCWIVDAEQRTDIIAWMPLPKPWKGEER